jgi:predicted nucleotidyltransferase
MTAFTYKGYGRIYTDQEYIEDLIEALDEQATTFLKRVKEFKDSAEGVA